jgi:ubiquitin C-terminal hydrolase
LPALADHELELVVKDAVHGYTAGQSVRSVSKIVGNFRFRLLIFPSGTHSTGGQQVSAFVEADPIDGLDPRWVYHGVKYQVTCVNHHDYRRSVTKVDTWTFSKEGIDRGWHDMVRTADLVPETGWLGPESSLYFRASCYVRQADSINVSNEYNVRKETGYIGLKNHGATCYMNGLLQSLFHVGEFRRIVYSIDCNDDTPDSPGKGDDPDMDLKGVSDADGESKAPPLIQALQNVFYKLQTSDQAVNCRELMKSFGWDTMDAFTQHDAQELNRILCDRLEEQMKGTPMDGSIKRLFEGEMENYIECIDVDYKSKRNETFYDIQLNIKSERGHELQNIDESLREFTAEETLEGDNLYEAEGHGKQRAKKGIRFLAFPPVLNLQLKRFHFDLEKMDMVKLNSRFEFQRRLDLSSHAMSGGTYLLHAVVVHSGDVNSGHYYAFIRPTIENQWFKFDDDTVTPCTDYAAVEDNYGGNDLMAWNYFERTPRELHNMQIPTRPRIHNAYMLVYIREDCAAEVLRAPDPKATNLQMVERCDREVRMAEQRRREKIEQQLKIRIKVVFESDLCKMLGFWDHQEIVERHKFKVNREQMVKDIMADIETLCEVPRAHLVLFSLHYRNNPRQVRFAFMNPSSTFRSHIPQFSAPHFDSSDPYLTVLCVAARGYDIQTFKWKPSKEGNSPDELMRWHDDQVIMLIVKWFCMENRKIVTLGCYYLSNNDPLVNMVLEGWVTERLKPYIERKEVAPLPDDADEMSWECWEEFNERDIQARNVKRSVKSEQLWSGDVIVWQPPAKRQRREEEDGKRDRADDAEAGEGDALPPLYPVLNVADLAAHLANSIDVVVTFHDYAQPLCVDGIVSNGHWTRPAPKEPRDPKKGDVSPSKEDRPEEEALQLSSAKFRMPREKEMKMDLRWYLHHVTGMISQQFDRPLSSEAPLWLFNGAPSSTAEEPLNSHAGRSEQISLKELQRSTMYISSTTKKPLVLHAVEVPIPGGKSLERSIANGFTPFCIRFFDDAVREVGCVIISVSSNGIVSDVINEAKKMIEPEWGISGNLRVLEVSDGRVLKMYRPDASVRALAAFSKSNTFYHYLRVEADPENAAQAEAQKVIEIYHCDRQSQQAFAQPILLGVTPGEKSGNVKARCKAKLQVPDAEFKSWRLVRCGRGARAHLKDEDPWDADPALDTKLCLEHVHPNPTNSLARQSRYNKPLTIK